MWKKHREAKGESVDGHSKLIFTTDERLVKSVAVENRVFVFWQNGGGLPEYIKLCLKTFLKYNPSKTLFFLNYDNIGLLCPELKSKMNMTKFHRTSLPMQSDILLMNVLLKFGGTFIDADMIFTGSAWFDEVFASKRQVLSGFGVKGNHMHLALISCNYEANHYLGYLVTEQLGKFDQIPENGEYTNGGKGAWFGIDVVGPLVKRFRSAEDIFIADNKLFLLEIFEAFNFKSVTGFPYGQDLYQSFYFGEPGNSLSLEHILHAAHYDIIALHNSWTPKEYKEMSIPEFVNSDLLISRIFKRLLTEDEINETCLMSLPISVFSRIVT